MRCKRRILLVIEGEGGGAVSHVLLLAKHLKGEGFVTLIAFLTEGPSIDVAQSEGIDFARIPKKCFLDPSPVWGLIKLINEQEVDIVHTHTIRSNYYGRLAALLCGRQVKCVTTVHSHIVDELKGQTDFGLREWLLSKRESLTWRCVNHFVCVSEKLALQLQANGVPEQKISVVPNAVELPALSSSHDNRASAREEFNIGDRKIVVGIVGRLVPLKNHHLFLRAAQCITATEPRVEFLIVGDGPLFDILTDMARRYGLEERVKFTGWRNDIQRVLCAFDIFVICSKVEGLNMSLLEAMANAVPVVGTDVKGVSEVISDGDTGILVAPNDVSALAEGISRLVKDGQLRREMGQNGRRLIGREYSIQNFVDNTSQFYDELAVSLNRNVQV